MTEELKQAKYLIALLGAPHALAHVNYVLSPDFDLQKRKLREFWISVGSLIQLHIDRQQPKPAYGLLHQ